MPAHRTSNEAKAAAGTARAGRMRSPVKLAALTRWPAAPKSFTDAERACWKRLGKALLLTGAVSAADLLFAELVAQEMARSERLRADPDEKATAITAQATLLKGMFASLGISAQGRERVQALPAEAPDEEEDDLAEFES